MASTIPTTLLPESLQEMAAHIPLDAVLRLAERYGGAVLCIPKQAPEGGELLAVVGQAAVAALVAAYGGEKLEIPRAERFARAVRDWEIVRLRRAGTPLKALARDNGTTVRNVSRILRAAAP